MILIAKFVQVPMFLRLNSKNLGGRGHWTIYFFGTYFYNHVILLVDVKLGTFIG